MVFQCSWALFLNMKQRGVSLEAKGLWGHALSVFSVSLLKMAFQNNKMILLLASYKLSENKKKKKKD